MFSTEVVLNMVDGCDSAVKITRATVTQLRNWLATGQEEENWATGVWGHMESYISFKKL